MKSRILKTVGLIAAMVSCIGMTAFAAPSPAASTVVTAVSSATDTDGNAVNVSISSEIPTEYTQAVADIKTEAELKEVLGSDFNANMTVADVKEVTAPEGAKFPLKITFAMKGVTASSKVQILHYNAKKAAWEKIDTTVADGTVTGTFGSLSPVAFVVDKTTDKNLHAINAVFCGSELVRIQDMLPINFGSENSVYIYTDKPEDAQNNFKLLLWEISSATPFAKPIECYVNK